MSSPVQVGEIVAGKYRVDAVLGQGGMGVVVAATDTILDRRVAVKFLLPQYAENKVASGRFLREARATARLNSEHAVRIIEVGELETGSPFMAMEFLQGVDLGTYIEQHGALEVRLAVDYVIQAARGLAEAHKAGIIHRDVKPSNLFLAYQPSGKPVVKVLDFGVSKLNLGADASVGSLTTTGQTLGSPLYMSPEQMRSSHAADARSDVWGLGVVLFELLTGARPFSAESLTELVLIINQDPPVDPKVLRPDLPDALCKAVLRCLEKDPNRRFASIAAMADEISAFGSRDSRAAARAIKGLMDSGAVKIPGAPKVGKLGTMIAPPGDPSGFGQSSIPVSFGAPTNGDAALAMGALPVTDGKPPVGSRTSAPWASTHDGSAGIGPQAKKKKGVGLGLVLGAVFGSGALIVVILVVVFWPNEPKEDDAIVSAASELSESAARESRERGGATDTSTAGAGSVPTAEVDGARLPTLESAAMGTSGAPAVGGAGAASTSEAQDENAEIEDETKKAAQKRRRPSPRPRPAEPKTPEDRLGF